MDLFHLLQTVEDFSWGGCESDIRWIFGDQYLGVEFIVVITFQNASHTHRIIVVRGCIFPLIVVECHAKVDDFKNIEIDIRYYKWRSFICTKDYDETLIMIPSHPLTFNLILAH